MAVLTGGPLGTVKNKLGGTVGFQNQGQNVLRAYVVPNNPNAPGQVDQRNKFRAAVQANKDINPGVLRPLGNGLVTKGTPFSRAMGWNTELYDPTGLLIQPADFRISSGDLTPQTIGSTTAVGSSGTITINWTSNAGTGNATSTDLIYVTVYNTTQDRWYQMLEPVARSTNQLIIAAGGGNIATGDDLIVYTAFTTASGTRRSSNTVIKTVTAS